jgi:hypothetical protein
VFLCLFMLVLLIIVCFSKQSQSDNTPPSICTVTTPQQSLATETRAPLLPTPDNNASQIVPDNQRKESAQLNTAATHVRTRGLCGISSCTYYLFSVDEMPTTSSIYNGANQKRQMEQTNAPDDVGDDWFVLQSLIEICVCVQCGKACAS